MTLRILHVVTLITPTGAYGGPVRVALNQCAELQRRGHEVVLTGAYRGYGTPPTEHEGVRLKLFPARRLVPRAGFAGLVSPSLIGWMRRNAPSFDVVHVHAARDLVTLPAALLGVIARKTVVLQPHGMIVESAHPLSSAMDGLLTRPLLRRAARVLHLTEAERLSLLYVGVPPGKLAHLGNGVPAADIIADVRVPTDVLFMGRLHERKRPLMLARVALQLMDEFPETSFSFVGPDEGEGAALDALIADSANCRITYEGALPLDRTLERMKQSDLFVLPSVDEPYPMSVLEAMSVGLPVVVTDSCGIANEVERWEAGIVIRANENALRAAVSTLLADQVMRERLGANAARAARNNFSVEAVAKALEVLYGEAASERRTAQ